MRNRSTPGIMSFGVLPFEMVTRPKGKDFGVADYVN